MEFENNLNVFENFENYPLKNALIFAILNLLQIEI